MILQTTIRRVELDMPLACAFVLWHAPFAPGQNFVGYRVQAMWHSGSHWVGYRVQAPLQAEQLKARIK